MTACNVTYLPIDFVPDPPVKNHNLEEKLTVIVSAMLTCFVLGKSEKNHPFLRIFMSQNLNNCYKSAAQRNMICNRMLSRVLEIISSFFCDGLKEVIASTVSTGAGPGASTPAVATIPPSKEIHPERLLSSLCLVPLYPSQFHELYFLKSAPGQSPIAYEWTMCLTNNNQSVKNQRQP